MQPHKRITLRELTEITGLSRTTIYNVLNDKGNFSEDTRRAVLDAMERYHYRPNLNARNLALGRDYIIAYVGLCSEQDTYYNQDIQRGLNRAVRQFEDDGLRLINRVCTMEKGQNQQAMIRELVDTGIEHFIIFSSPGPDSDRCVQELIDMGKTVVLLSNRLNVKGELAFIGCDYYRSGILCGQLMEKFCGSPSRIQVFMNRVSPVDLSTTDRFRGLTDYLASIAKEISVCEPFYLNQEQEHTAQRMQSLIKRGNADGIVSIISGTAQVCRQIEESCPALPMVSFDLYDEVVPFLEQGIISAVIDQDLDNQAYQAVKTLFHYLCYQQQPEESVHYAPLNIVLQANLPYFLHC